MNMITMIDPPTWHDQRPTHTSKPAIVIDAQVAANSAWRKVYELSDDYEAGRVDLDTVTQATEQAKAADLWYQNVYHAWERGDEGAIACYCTPTGDTCANCRAKIAANVDSVFNF
mgnify:CR=1 FL=1